jgi:hypothetical protein
MKKISLRKPSRGRGKLINLPDEQRALLINWMMSDTPYAELLPRVNKQFGLSYTSTVPLERFYKRFCRPILLQKRADELRAAAAVSSTARKDIKKLLENPEADIEELKEVLKQVIANDENPGTKPAHPAHAKETTTDEANPLDDQEKLDEIRRQVFGSAPQS